MAYKRYKLPEIGNIVIYKRRGAKAIKLSVGHDEEIKVTIPQWTPYQLGVEFVRRNQGWIDEHKPINKEIIKSGLRIGKAHVFNFISTNEIDKISTRVSGNEARIYLPTGTSYESEPAQLAAKKSGLRTLRSEAESLLPKRLDGLAEKYGFSYRGVRIKQLKSRWGSCNSEKDITLNFYLMQLPWELIDYVILHELTHTKVLAHGPKFWDELKKILPDVASLKKEILKYKPFLNTINA